MTTFWKNKYTSLETTTEQKILEKMTLFSYYLKHQKIFCERK